MSDVVLKFRGRPVHTAEVLFVRELIAQNPHLSRHQLSKKVCQAWGWVQPNGQLRDMVCRSLLLQLHRAGAIELPAPKFCPPNNAILHRRADPVDSYTTDSIQGSVGSLEPLEIRPVRRTHGEKLFGHLLSRYHYLGYSRPVGEHLKYLILSQDRPIACLGWSSAPRQLNLRDEFLGLAKAAYRHNLHLIAYNTRYLILPWVQVPGLASHLLGAIARRISQDWQALYHHPIYLLESFVDIERFLGTCYRAANWRCLGRSIGRGTKAQTKEPTTSIKELWVYPLAKDLPGRLAQRS